MVDLLFTVLIGVGATVVADLWGLIRKPLLGVAPPNYSLVGRWFGYFWRGRFFHRAIAKSSPIPGERALGWTAHYLIGVAFAGILVGFTGSEWLRHPELLPALAVGIGTVAAPFLVMQPGMGAGFAAARTPDPTSARLHSLLMHTVFGLGLFASGWFLHAFYPN